MKLEWSSAKDALSVKHQEVGALESQFCSFVSL